MGISSKTPAQTKAGLELARANRMREIDRKRNASKQWDPTGSSLESFGEEESLREEAGSGHPSRSCAAPAPGYGAAEEERASNRAGTSYERSTRSIIEPG
jgi:hypothetical protein